MVKIPTTHTNNTTIENKQLSPVFTYSTLSDRLLTSDFCFRLAWNHILIHVVDKIALTIIYFKI